MTIDLLGSSRDHTFYGPSKGPIFSPRIEGPHSAGGSTQVHEGPHRDHGHVLHKVLIYVFHEVNFSYERMKVKIISEKGESIGLGNEKNTEEHIIYKVHMIF